MVGAAGGGAVDAVDDLGTAAALARMEALVAERPADDGAALYELGSLHDSIGNEVQAEGLYRRAFAAGLGHDALAAFLSLALSYTGQERDAVGVALTALAPHLPRYERSVRSYAAELRDRR